MRHLVYALVVVGLLGGQPAPLPGVVTAATAATAERPIPATPAPPAAVSRVLPSPAVLDPPVRYTDRAPDGRVTEALSQAPVRPRRIVTEAELAGLRARQYVSVPTYDGPREYVIAAYDTRPRPREDADQSGVLPGITWSRYPQTGPCLERERPRGRWQR